MEITHGTDAAAGKPAALPRPCSWCGLSSDASHHRTCAVVEVRWRTEQLAHVAATLLAGAYARPSFIPRYTEAANALELAATILEAAEKRAGEPVL